MVIKKNWKIPKGGREISKDFISSGCGGGGLGGWVVDFGLVFKSVLLHWEKD